MSTRHFWQSTALVSARVLGVLATVMTLVWTCQTNTAEKFLGGLNTEDLIFNWHPFLMVLGLCSFLTNGITAYRTTGMTHAHAKVAHVTWYVFSFLSAMLGLTAVFKSHERSVTANMYSLHSWIGIGAIALFGLNFVCGLFCFWNPLYVTSVSLRDAYKSYHIFGGILAFSFALVAIETGLLEKNTFLGCTYVVSALDSNPSSHYHLLPNGCKLSNGIGVVVLFVFVLVMFGMANLEARDTFPLPAVQSVKEMEEEEWREQRRLSYTNLDQADEEAC